MNTTGNPGSGETGPTGPAAPHAGPPGHHVGSPDQQGSDGGYGEPLGDYGYSGGYGYGPGYGDPDGGGGYSYGPGYAGPGPGYADPGDAAGYGYGAPSGGEGYRPPPGGPGEQINVGQAAGNLAGGPAAAGPAAAGRTAAGPGGVAFQPVQPVVAATPALKGYPGGPGLDAPADDQAAPAGREARGLSSPSVWQHAQKAWRESGVEWQRPVADWEPAEAEWERVQATPAGRHRGGADQAGWSAGTSQTKLSGKFPAKSLGTMPGSAKSLAGKSLGGKSLSSKSLGGKSPGGTSAGGAFHVRRGVWQAALAVIVVLAVIVAAFLAFGGSGGTSTGSAALAQYPPARPAAADFGTNPAQQGRGIFQSVSGVAASAGTVVAVGSETGQWIPRAQFLVSVDGGHSWRLAAVRAAGGAAPSPADQPHLVAGGPGGWLALGSGASWTSPNGRIWTLAAGGGIAPLLAGDRVLALARTGSGFLAVGENVPGGKAASSPVAWTSPNGLNWQRLNAAKLHLPAPGGSVLNIGGVAARGSDAIIDGEIVSTHGKGRHRTTSRSLGVWQSGNDGASWVSGHLPLGSGVKNWIDGIAATGSGFVAIRPGSTKRTGSDAVAYVSPGGAYWTRAAAITAGKKANLQVTMVGGSDQGVAVSGRVADGTRVAYVSTNGSSWGSVANVGGSAESLAGVTVTTGGTVVAGGSTGAGSQGQQPYLVLAGAHASTVSFAGIAGATGPSLDVTGIVVAGGRQIAVGTANGFPAIWSARSSGHWTPISSAALVRPGLAALTDVVHGPSGWLAVGGVVAAAPGHPIIVGSADGASWQPADGESAFAGPGITVRQAAAGRSGYVIVGQQVIPARTIRKTTVRRGHKKVIRQVIPSRTVAAAWWSAGLTGWTTAGGDLAGSSPRQMTAVTTGGPGFVAVGSVGKAPAVWTSTDGKQWQLIQLGPPGGASAAALQDVAAHGKVIVATGTQTTPTGTTPFAEYSTDGGTLWQPAPLTAPGGSAAITALTTAGKGFVAAGTVGQPGNQRVVVWSMTGGTSWKAHEPTGAGLSGLGSQAITALTASGPVLTGVGYTATPKGEQATLWKASAGPG